MFSSVLPSYDFSDNKKGKGKESGPVINGDDPKNKEMLKAIFRGDIV